MNGTRKQQCITDRPSKAACRPILAARLVGWLVGWRLTVLSAMIGYIVPRAYEINYVVYVRDNHTLTQQAVREAATICPRPCKLTLTFDLESGVRVTCDVTYLCANFSLPSPLCSRLRPDVRDRQTSDAHRCLMHPTLGAGA